MVGELPSYIIVHWFDPTSRDCPNPAKFKFNDMVVVTRAFLRKDPGMRVVWMECEWCRVNSASL